jgi:hypothetical protein
VASIIFFIQVNKKGNFIMINNVTFTGAQKQVQQFMTNAAHEFLPTGKIFDKAEIAAANEAAKAAKAAADELAEVPFFNHRGNNVVDDSVAKLQDAAAAKSYAKSHGIQVADEVEEAVLKANA